MPLSDFPSRSVRRLISPSLAPLPSKLIPFYVYRHTDLNGNSGTGIVAEGCVFSDGRCVLHWLNAVSSTAFFESVSDLMAIHGHGGKTIVLMWQ